ncbi:MAG: Na+/H+ antiporter subunit E [Rhodospirillaceae bacterium]|jgi:multicomponent Na+:H+ antiporter subunit E|nr:Na+/H+ antiporter subunit E [Rhodospirillaceae bacterium]MBT3885494.1 Na+/H+ antiporter subunit E [Rhodospirillaceae bacterium]MBT4115860.1 Na+/H+ antiporter subunit E [Rhodospirillaceae bacterium]MBT4721644.1 Na+/H+ antiporter subunit E [Rhodospirillaceae bacterium]MBT4750497.1 Na+/H+ antiporter subunit E [Rhodospirillaceae bacterium]
MLRHVSLGVVLFILWLALSGHFHELILIELGVVSSIFVVWIAHRMNLADDEGHPIQMTLGALSFLPWLAWEIIKANIDVARIILSPSLPISPVLFKVKASQVTEVGMVAYANSITLTPGTVTVDVDDASSEFTIHAITAEAANELETGRMDRRAVRMEGVSGRPTKGAD